MKDKIILISLFCSILGLVLIYISAKNLKPIYLEIDQINPILIGRYVSTIGYISRIRKHPEGHIFLTISNGKKKVNIPLFSDLVNTLNENGIKVNDFKKGRKIAVSGFVSEYMSRIQIIPRKPEDIKLR
jgi:DNA/RNA endonuclease YhcR with UshA esterase domain